MFRPWHIWTAFGLCLAVAFLALVWVSKAALRLDRNEQLARKTADREEIEQLALWRLDSALTPIVSQESAQPYFAYQAFSPAERAYTRMFNEVNPGEIMIPSPLLMSEHPFVLLHFQVGPDGKFTSPEIPTGALRALAEKSFISAEKIKNTEKQLFEISAPFNCRSVLDKLPPATSVENPPMVTLSSPVNPPTNTVPQAQGQSGTPIAAPNPSGPIAQPQQTIQSFAPELLPNGALQNPVALIQQKKEDPVQLQSKEAQDQRDYQQTQEFLRNQTTGQQGQQGELNQNPQGQNNFQQQEVAQNDTPQEQARALEEYRQRKMQTIQSGNRSKGSVEYQKRQEAYQQALNVNKSNPGNGYNSSYGNFDNNQQQGKDVPQSKEAPQGKEVVASKVPELPQVQLIPPTNSKDGKDGPTPQTVVPIPQQDLANLKQVEARVPIVEAMQGAIQKSPLANEKPGHLTSTEFNQPPLPPAHIQVGVFQPLWHGNRLLLARRVKVDRQEYIQACVLQWELLRADLLERIADLLPNAKLEPVVDTSEAWSAQPVSSNPTPAATRMLAFLPVKLIAGDIPEDAVLASSAAGVGGLSPIAFSLLLAWTCIVLAAVAVGGLLWGVLGLSERRASFVSAVTHELRTPLTTFKLYAEMLEEDMVPNPETRRDYLRTLRSEADRLGHLVENVLDYARLENGRAGGRVEDISGAKMLERFRARLESRAKLSGLKLEVLDPVAPSEAGSHVPTRGVALEQSWKAATSELIDDALVRPRRVDPWETPVHVDPSAVERILFNLVDNAGKYASSGTDHRIVLEARVESQVSGIAHGQVVIRVRDFGPGFSTTELRKLFRPFSKSARQAAESAPGVGLGLALSRRLARGMGGDLVLRSDIGPGACFELALPMPVKS